MQKTLFSSKTRHNKGRIMKRIKDFKIKAVNGTEADLLDKHLRFLVGNYKTSISSVLTELSEFLFLHVNNKPTSPFTHYLVQQTALDAGNLETVSRVVKEQDYEKLELPEFTLYDFLQYQGEPEGIKEDAKEEPARPLLVGKTRYRTIFYRSDRKPMTTHYGHDHVGVRVKYLNRRLAEKTFSSREDALDRAFGALEDTGSLGEIYFQVFEEHYLGTAE